MSTTSRDAGLVAHETRAAEPVIIEREQPQVIGAGIQGPPGPRGEKGDKGDNGAEADSFTFTQASPALQWSISHNLGRRPIVELFSVGGAQINADVLHLSNDQALVSFVIPVAGSARLI